MDWDLTLEQLRREAFRPTIPPPVRMPRWAVAALVGAGLTFSGAACDRGGTGRPDPAPEMAPVNADAGAVMPPETPPMPPPPQTPPPPEKPPEPPPTTDSTPIEALPPMPEEMKIAPLILPMAAPAYGMPLVRRPMEPVESLPAPMYGGPGLSGLPTVSASGLVPGDAPTDVRKVLQGFPYLIGSCYRQAAYKGAVGKTGDLSVSLKVSDGRFTVLSLGGSLSGTAAVAECVKNRINSRTMGSSDEARAYSRSWTFSVQIVASSPE